MRWNSKGLVTVALLGGIMGGSFIGAVSAGAETNDQQVIDERWGNPVLVYGASLDTGQLDKTRELLGIDVSKQSVDIIPVSGQDLVKYLGSGNPNANMYSSALVTKGEEGSGVVVEIKTPENITEVTSTQYANAMITAGVTDSEVLVASPVKVTGESALTGIYKAYEDRGVVLDQDRMAVAQEELETTSDIAKTLEGNEQVTSENLDQALIDIKTELASAKEKEGALVSKEDVKGIVTAALAENGLGDAVTSGQVDQLVDLAMNYQNTDAIDSEAVKEKLKSLAGSVANTLSDLNKMAEESGLWDKLGQFFVDIWGAIKGLFS